MTARRASILLLLAFILAGCAPAAHRETRTPRLISTRGVGRVSVKPDTAVVRLGAEMRAPALADATADVARRSTAIIERVKALGVAERDITTVTYSIDPLTAPRRTEEDPTRIVAYRVANVIQVKIRDLAAVGRVLDGALTAGANTMSGLSFTMDDPTKPEAEARALAVKAADATARQLAAAAGVSLGELMTLTEDASSRPIVLRGATAAMAAGPVEPGQIEIVVTVEVQYRIGP